MMSITILYCVMERRIQGFKNIAAQRAQSEFSLALDSVESRHQRLAELAEAPLLLALSIKTDQV